MADTMPQFLGHCAFMKSYEDLRASLKTLPFMASTRHPSPEEKGTRSF